jgi:hypothetical protein
MEKYCTNCDAVLDEGAQFCAKCGTPVPAQSAPALQMTEIPKPSSQPCPTQTHVAPTQQQTAKPSRKKKTGNDLCIALAVLLMLESVIVALFGWPGFAVRGGFGKTSTFKLAEGQTAVTTKSGVSIDFGQYNSMVGAKVAITELGGEMDEVQGGYITPYDISVEGREQFDGLITITLPYDEGKTIPGDEKNSVLAQYQNPETGEWELVDYTVNVDDNTVTIYTDHLSKYCTTTVNDPATPYAHIARIGNLRHMDTGRAIAILNEVQTLGQPAKQTQSLAMELLDTCFYYPNLALGGETSDKIPLTANLMDWLFDVAEPLGPMMKQIGEVSTACGVAFSGAQVCYAIYQNESDALIAAEAYKSAYQTAIAYYNSYGPYAMKLSMLGVIAIDYSLNRFLDEANQTYKDDIYTIVKYYNEKEAPRTDKQWYDMIIKLYRQRGDNPKKFKSALEGLIYNFSARFFQLDYNAQSNTAGFAEKKLPYITLDAQNYCVEQYVARLGERLQPVLKDVMKQISYEANKDYRTNLKKLTALLNQNIIIDVLEEIPDGKKSVYAKSTVALVQGENKPDKKWLFQLDGKGCASFGSTILGYMQAGCPTTLKLWLPGKDPENDKPDLTQSFVLSDKVTSVVLKDTGIDAKWFEGNWRHVDSDITIRLGIIDNVNCYYAAEIEGEEVITYTTYAFNKETASLKMDSSDNNNKGGKFWINEIVWYGYEENGVDFIKTEKNTYQRIK